MKETTREPSIGNRQKQSASPSTTFVRGFVLLMIGEQPSHGYDLLEGLGRLGFDTDRGGLYRALRAMEQEGLVHSTVSASDLGPPRRTYELTKEGEEWLHDWAKELGEMQWIIRKCLRRYDSLLGDGQLQARRQAARHPLQRSSTLPSAGPPAPNAPPVHSFPWLFSAVGGRKLDHPEEDRG